MVWERLDVAGDIVVIQWIPKVTGSNWYANSVSQSTVVLCIGMDEVLAHYACKFENSDLHFHFQS